MPKAILTIWLQDCLISATLLFPLIQSFSKLCYFNRTLFLLSPLNATQKSNMKQRSCSSEVGVSGVGGGDSSSFASSPHSPHPQRHFQGSLGIPGTQSGSLYVTVPPCPLFNAHRERKGHPTERRRETGFKEQSAFQIAVCLNKRASLHISSDGIPRGSFRRRSLSTCHAPSTQSGRLLLLGIS